MTVEQLWQPVPGGSGSYVTELADALARREDVAVTGVAAWHSDRRPPHARLAVPVRRAPLPRAVLYEAWNRWRLPRAEQAVPGTDVVHATTWAVPGTRRPLVVTVHDLAFLRSPEHFTPRGDAFFRRALEVVRDEATRVVVPSAATRDDCRAAGLDDARLVVVPHGVRASPVTEQERADWRRRHGVARPYVLWCGTLEPRKNVRRLVAAYAAARAAGAVEHDLVLVGPTGWGGEADAVAAALRGVPDGAVHLLGRLDDADLQRAYSGADAFAFPSLWEGFGMPVLEATAHGVPVLTSAASPMAELVGPHGVLVDPSDTDAIAAGLAQVLRPVDRAGLRAHAARYTWDACAQAHVEVYRAAAGAASPGRPTPRP